MKKILVLVSLSLVISGAVAAQESASAVEAAKIWEQAIAAKGGRERLRAVRNILIVSSGSYKGLRFTIRPGQVKSKTLKPSGLYREQLFVFPDKYWSWEDYRPAVFGLWIKVYDHTRKMKYVITEGEPNHPEEPIEPKEMKGRPLLFVELMYLLESNWLKPRPVDIRREGTIDNVQTEVDGQQFDFAIDRKTNLVTKFTSFSEFRGTKYVHVVKFSDYRKVQGIMVPHLVEMEDGHKEYCEIRINVDYEERIFITPPSIDAGPHAWMKTR
jgi:hypothetical protein